tara:strand:+ start:171 stop:512 length:342 start_codon:yes stop_codon:yes gene_type:complete
MTFIKTGKLIFMIMDVNIEIYIRQLKEFFKNDKEARKDMFVRLDVDMEQFFKLVRVQAEKNVGKDGDPMLSTEQMATITAIIMEQKTHLKNQTTDMKKIFKTIIVGHPPMCLN